MSTSTEKAPSFPADAFPAVEDALLRGSLDIAAELHRRFPPGKPPIYHKTRKRYRELALKHRMLDAALVELDRLRGHVQQLVAPPRAPVPGPQVVQANGADRHEYDAGTLRAAQLAAQGKRGAAELAARRTQG